MNKRFIKHLVDRTAELAIGPSTVRNQGARGVAEAARQSLKKIDLQRYKRARPLRFVALLDEDTRTLQRSLPRGARNWGTARKCLNIFLRDIFYSRYLNKHFRFAKLQGFLELPLDGNVAKALGQTKEGSNLPRWHTIRGLQPKVNEEYQVVAKAVGKRLKLHAVHLDIYLWRNSATYLILDSRR